MSLDGVLLTDVTRLQRECDSAHCLAVTGPRGSGKSFVLRAFVAGVVRRQLAHRVEEVSACLQLAASTSPPCAHTPHTHDDAHDGLDAGCVCVLDYVGLCRLLQHEQQRERQSSSSTAVHCMLFRCATILVIDNLDVLWRLCRMQSSTTATATHASRHSTLAALLVRCLAGLRRSPRCVLVTSSRAYTALPRFLRTAQHKLLPPLHYALPEQPLSAAVTRRLVYALSQHDGVDRAAAAAAAAPLPPPLHDMPTRYSDSGAQDTRGAGDVDGVCATAPCLAEAVSRTSSRHAAVMAWCVAAHTRDAAAVARTVHALAADEQHATDKHTATAPTPTPAAAAAATATWHNSSSGCCVDGLAVTTLYGLDDIATRLRKLVCMFVAYHRHSHNNNNSDNNNNTSSSSSAVSGSGGALLASLRGTTGVLLHGPSGCGKTTLTRRLAAQLPDVDYTFVSCTRLFSRYLGESEERLRRVYRRARARSPAVVVLDNMDVIAQSRAGTQSNGDDAGGGDSGNGGGSGGGGSSRHVDVHRRMLACLLCELDGVGDNSRVLTIGTTSALSVMDAALLRQGRLETLLRVPALSRAAAQAMALHTFVELTKTSNAASDAVEAATSLAACVAVRAERCAAVALRYILRKVVEHTLVQDDDDDDDDDRRCACRQGGLPARACLEALLTEHASMLQPVE